VWKRRRSEVRRRSGGNRFKGKRNVRMDVCLLHVHEEEHEGSQPYVVPRNKKSVVSLRK